MRSSDPSMQTMKIRSLLGNRILTRFVASSTCVPSFFLNDRLTFRFQTEFATNTGANVPEIRHSASNIYTTVPDPHRDISSAGVSKNRHDVMSTHTVVSGVHHKVVHHQPIVSGAHGDDSGGHTVAPSVILGKMGYREHANDQIRAVSTTLTPPAARQSLIST